MEPDQAYMTDCGISQTDDNVDKLKHDSDGILTPCCTYDLCIHMLLQTLVSFHLLVAVQHPVLWKAIKSPNVPIGSSVAFCCTSYPPHQVKTLPADDHSEAWPKLGSCVLAARDLPRNVCWPFQSHTLPQLAIPTRPHAPTFVCSHGLVAARLKTAHPCE